MITTKEKVIYQEIYDRKHLEEMMDKLGGERDKKVSLLYTKIQ